MTAAKRNSIVATKPLEPYDGPETAPAKHATFKEHQAWQAGRWQGMLVAFDHPEHGRCIGRAKAVKPLGRDSKGIPDYGVTVESLANPDNRIDVRMVSARCDFYGSEDEAKKDPRWKREQVKEGKQ